MALAGAPATTAIVASLPRETSLTADATPCFSRELGGALGIAVLGSLFNGGYRSEVEQHTTGLTPSLADRATSSFAGAQQLGEQLGARGQQLLADAQTAYLHGLSLSLFAGAAVLVAGAIFVALRAPGRAESRANAGQAAPALAPAQST